MGLKCLLGHDYSAPEIERERVEDGDEVVTTLREVQTCTRCGETRVVSENTEVTTMARLTAEAETVGEGTMRTETLSSDSPAGAPSTAESSTDEPASAERSNPPETASSSADDASVSAATSETDEGVEFIEETTTDAATHGSASADLTGADPTDDREDSTGDRESSTTDNHGDPTEGREDPTDDGAEILESEPSAADGTGSTTEADGPTEAGGRERGAWPAVDAPADDAGTGGKHPSWPTHDAEDEGYDASASHGSSETDDETVAYVGGPASDDRATTTQADAGTELERSREQRHASTEETRLRGPTEYYCPACGMTTDTAGSSLRAGDVCPECRGGYVAERSQ